MINFISAPNSIGLEKCSSGILIALLAPKGKTGLIISLATLHPDSIDVKQLYKNHPIITTGLAGREVIIRPFSLPLTKDRDIQEALFFQAEPLLPYPAEQALLSHQVLSKGNDNSEIILFAARREAVQSHIDGWKGMHIEPEKVTSVSSALANFGSSFLPDAKNYLIIHLQPDETTCIVMKDGKIWASFAQPEGLHPLLSALAEQSSSHPQNEDEWQACLNEDNALSNALKRLQKEIARMGFALAKEVRKASIEGIVITGAAADKEGLSNILIQNLQLPLFSPSSSGQYSSQELLKFAVPIGLALGSLPNQSQTVDFRQQEAAFPHPWVRLKVPVAAYFISVALLTLAFYFYSNQTLNYQENQIKQSYIDLLSGMNKSHEDIELALADKKQNKNDSDKSDPPTIYQLGKEELSLRLAYLQKELQANPDSFPLFPNTPRVSDVLAWLHQHPAAVFSGEDGKVESKIQIETFSYSMVKRPQNGKKGDKYQVKIELEFISPTPKWAREFHDALIAPNDWIDPKGEVKWNSNRGIYKTSFFLKDKTVYPG